MDAKGLLLAALLAGVVLVLVNELVAKAAPKVEYRYLPRDLDTYLREQPYPSVVYGAMFTDSDVIDTRRLAA